MTSQKRLRLAVLSALLAAASTLLLLALLSRPAPTHAAPAATIRYVATSGDDTASFCTDSANPCRTMQHAVNVAGWQANDEIRVATGVYTSASERVLFIQNTVHVRGGFTTTNWITPHPDSQPTILDGEGKDRVVYIYISAGTDITPTLEGLWITNGVVSTVGHTDFGGGIYSVNAHTIISGCHVVSNTADEGGGGVYLVSADNATLIGNTIERNRTTTQAGAGGGIFIGTSSNVRLTGNTIYSNTALLDGGAVFLGSTPGASLENNIIAENQCGNGKAGAGLYADGSGIDLVHTTIARNSGGEGQGVYATGSGTSIWMTNTILVSHTVGIETTGGAAVTATYTLWGDGTWANITDTVSSNIFTGTLASNWWEAPGFLDPDGGNYHIGGESGPLNRALATGLATDIDGDSRPFCGDGDLGADEASCCANLNGTLYPLVQAAVDASSSPSDVVRVAGICSGVNDRGDDRQTLYISKTVTIRGGYTVSDWSTSYPEANPSTLDAVGQGRVVYIKGYHYPVLEGLRLTNGSAPQHGGGVYAQYAHLAITACHVYSNTAAVQGGGIYLDNADSTRLAGNSIYWNTAGSGGGALSTFQSQDTELVGNTILENSVINGSGNVRLYYSDAVFTNNMVVDNRLDGSGNGSGFYLVDSDAGLLHTTIARNRGGNGQGVYVVGSGATAWMTNSIIVSHTVGVHAGGGGTAILAGTLWGEGAWANTTNTSGSVLTSADVSGDPAFADHDVGDYHITMGSAAINSGIGPLISTDIDGELRVGAPDLGADEFVLSAYLPLVLRNH